MPSNLTHTHSQDLIGFASFVVFGFAAFAVLASSPPGTVCLLKVKYVDKNTWQKIVGDEAQLRMVFGFHLSGFAANFLSPLAWTFDDPWTRLQIIIDEFAEIN